MLTLASKYLVNLTDFTFVTGDVVDIQCVSYLFSAFYTIDIEKMQFVGEPQKDLVLRQMPDVACDVSSEPRYIKDALYHVMSTLVAPKCTQLHTINASRYCMGCIVPIIQTTT